MRFINLTPHTINVLDMDGNPVLDIPISGEQARCSSSEDVFAIVDGIPLLRQTFGKVTVEDTPQDVWDILPSAEPTERRPFPAPREGVILVVSRLVAAALPERDDLFCPGPLVRNAEGQPVGCRGLSRV